MKYVVLAKWLTFILVAMVTRVQVPAWATFYQSFNPI